MNKFQPLLPYLRPYRKMLVAGILSILVSAWIGLMAPLVIGGAIDTLRGMVTSRGLLAYGGLLVGISLAQGVFNFLQRKILVTMSRDIEVDLRADLFSHLERLHMGYFQDMPTGDLMARATNDLEAVRRMAGPAVMYASNTVFAASGALFFMFRIHWELTLLSLCTLPLIAVITKIFGQRLHQLFGAVQKDFSSLSAKVQENLAGGRVVRAYAQEAAEETAFDTISREYVESNRRLIRWDAGFRPMLVGTVGLGFAAVLFFGCRYLIAGEISVGQLVTFNLFLAKLTWPMIAIGWVINMTQRGLASFDRIRAILEQEPAIQDEPPLTSLGEVKGEVAFHGLGFTYESATEPVLHGIEAVVPAGATVAIVGRTGSGKSTLLSLLPRLLNPPAGSLTLDGVDVRRLPLAELRGAIAMVPQETFLFSATIAENVALGRPEASREEITEAVDLAGLAMDVEVFPDGLGTMVGERGITLSGGQKQRVALARALLRRPPILVLDDCLSAVDAETEERILGNLAKVFPGRTVFQVSHRVSAVQGADLILVLDHGRIVERGTHQDLLALGGHYADLERRQRLEEQLAAV